MFTQTSLHLAEGGISWGGPFEKKHMGEFYTHSIQIVILESYHQTFIPFNSKLNNLLVRSIIMVFKFYIKFQDIKYSKLSSFKKSLNSTTATVPYFLFYGINCGNAIRVWVILYLRLFCVSSLCLIFVFWFFNFHSVLSCCFLCLPLTVLNIILQTTILYYFQILKWYSFHLLCVLTSCQGGLISHGSL